MRGSAARLSASKTLTNVSAPHVMRFLEGEAEGRGRHTMAATSGRRHGLDANAHRGRQYGADILIACGGVRAHRVCVWVYICVALPTSSAVRAGSSALTGRLE